MIRPVTHVALRTPPIPGRVFEPAENLTQSSRDERTSNMENVNLFGRRWATRIRCSQVAPISEFPGAMVPTLAKGVGRARVSEYPNVPRVNPKLGGILQAVCILLAVTPMSVANAQVQVVDLGNLSDGATVARSGVVAPPNDFQFHLKENKNDWYRFTLNELTDPDRQYTVRIGLQERTSGTSGETSTYTDNADICLYKSPSDHHVGSANEMLRIQAH